MTNSLLEGLHTNYTPFKQPENSYRFALNSMISNDIATLTNEVGTSIKEQLPINYKLIGAIKMNDEVCLFSTDGTNSEIGVLSNTYSTYINTPDLNFTYTNMIKGVFRIKNGCERIVYFCDGVNPDRIINLDNLNQYGSPFNAELTKYYPNYTRPSVTETVQNTGGLLELGTYEIAFTYVTENGNTTDIIGHSLPICIYDDYTSNVNDNIDGGYNVADFTPTEGGVLPSTKKIDYYFTDLDTAFPYIRIFITATIGGNGTTKLVYREYDLSIPDTGILTFSLDKLNDLIVAAEGDVTINNTKYITSENILLHSNRQLRFNLTENVYDYASLQQAANDILVSYKTISIVNSDVSNNYKSPKASPTYMRDEVYSLGIVYIYRDGHESPVMHIPGRPKNIINFWGGDLKFESDLANILTYTTLNSPNHIREIYIPYLLTNFDTDTLLVGTQISEDEVKHLEYVNGDYVPYYKIFNTAVRAYQEGTTYYGSLAYHESDTRYPSVKDCNGNLIYPSDPLDNTQPDFIRHHKMPDSHIEPFYDAASQTIRPLELVINNVSNPDPANIIGYYIVRADSTNDQTVLDKGLFYNSKMIAHKRDGLGNLTVLSDVGQNNILCDYPLFLNPVTGIVLKIDEYDYTNNSDQNGKWYGETSMTGPVYTLDLATNHIAFQSNMSEVKNTFANASYIVNETEFEFNWNINASDPSIETWVGYVGMPSITRDTTQVGYNYKVDTGLRIPFNNRLSNSLFTDGTKDVDVYNAGQNQSITYYQTNRDSSHTSYRLDYRDVSDDTLLDNINSYVRYGSVKILKDVYNNLSILQYYKTHTNVISNFGVNLNVNVKGGDTYIGKAVGRKTSDAHYVAAQRIGVGGGFQRLDVTTGTRGYWMSSAWIYYTESRINPDLRHEGSDLASKTLLRGVTPEKFLEPYDYSNSDNFENSHAYFYQNNFLYNDDYTNSKSIKIYYPLDNKFKYCDSCAGKFETRIIYSDPSLDESKTDNYLVFRANNYVDYPNDKGEIKNSYVVGNVLHVLTPRSHYVQPLSNQEMKTDVSTVYIGTGDFLSVPWQRREYAGTMGKFALSVTEYGNFYIDHLKRMIYHDEKAISELDMKTWLFDNMTTTLADKYKIVYSSEYEYIDSMLVNGVGTFITYDPLYQRVIITHKDYDVVSDKTISLLSGPDYVNFVNGNWEVDSSVVDINDTSIFINKSWTLSYYPKTGKFISFHSYNPTNWFSDDNVLYTCNNDNTIYSHDNETLYNNFYSTQYPWIVEVIGKNVETTTLESINYIGNSYSANVATDERLFNRFIAYTDQQCTGWQDLIYKSTYYDNIEYSGTEKYVSLHDDNHKLSFIRSLTTYKSVPTMTSDWAIRNPYYSTYGYIDKVPNPIGLSYTKSQYELELLRDKVFHIRFFDTISTSAKSLEMINITLKQSKR